MKSARAAGRDRGAGATDYIAVILVIAVIAAALAGSGVGGQVTGVIEASVCRVTTEQCAEPPAPQEERHPNPVTPAEWGNRGTNPYQKPPEPTDDEKKAGKKAADQIRDYLDDDCPWWKLWGCDKPRNPVDILRDMTPGQLVALFNELSDDEIRELMKIPGVAEMLRSRADPYLLRRIEAIAPGSIEPRFDDVREDGKKPSDPANGYGYISGGSLWGKNGEPSITDINQGAIGDCWWLASMGALARTEAGRQQLMNMIRQNPNGTYTVTFPDGSQVTVSPFFPVKKDGSTAYANAGQPPVLWPLILEKALAAKEGGYGELVGGYAHEGMETLTGKDSDQHDADDVSLDDMRQWIKDGKAISAASLQPDDSDGKKPYDDGKLVSAHAYIVKGITSDGKVELYNPWGHTHATLTMEEFNRLFDRVDVNSIR